ncbi:MAG TPA: response regulator [Pirellulales bacterium]|jgi:CheY-like chemotaxis protein|nr:response regulator [Pirellulales bacterium]
MPTVLVVDDSPVDRRLAGGILEKCSGLKVEYATNGAEALEKIQNSPPDAVLTDLQMPKMDGLELVGAVRSRFPLVPVILMTAHGSEDIAVQALARGASSYVPKPKLAQELPEVLESVLAVSKADRHNERLGECLHRTANDFVLDNDTALVYPLVDHCQRLVTRMKLCDETGRIRVGIALEEALLNALYHGNLELSADQLREARSGMISNGNGNLIEQRRKQAPYRDRRIHFQVSVSPKEASFVIRDEGRGFNPADVPDPTDPANLERESGRGLLLMRTFMDDVQYAADGRQVTLIKRLDSAK